MDELSQAQAMQASVGGHGYCLCEAFGRFARQGRLQSEEVESASAALVRGSTGRAQPAPDRHMDYGCFRQPCAQSRPLCPPECPSQVCVPKCQ